MALTVENVCFSYSKNDTGRRLLNDVCLTVSKGSIYALLGPSGCGKTTLFKLVIGLCKPDSGSISIFGFPPGSAESGVPGSGIGYMPQELSVQKDLTIFEILYYFGNLLGMSRKQLAYQIDYLVELFELPEKSRLIGKTSGGQQRRISMAVALLHKPRLLILDEPTVGVDPVLCQIIWDLLIKLSETEKTTIILTTHYIEETKRANFVGFMRKGEILEETSPENVLKNYGVNSLEDAFLNMCKEQKGRRKSLGTGENKGRKKRIGHFREPLPRSNLTRSLLFERQIITIIHKVMIETRRNPGTMIFLFVLAFITSALLTLWFGRTPEGLTIAWVVDEKPFKASSTFAGPEIADYNIDFKEDGENETEDDEPLPYIPDILRKSLIGDVISLKMYENIAIAESDLRAKRIYGVIHLRENFSRCYVECDAFLNLGQEFVDNATIECGTINLLLDTTNQILSSAIEYSVRDSMLEFQKEVAKSLGLSPHVFEKPLQVIPIYGKINKEDIFGVHDFIAPGLMYFVSYIFGYFPSIMAVALEQNDEMFVRNYVSGVTSLNLVTGQFIARFIFLALSNLINIFASIGFIGLQCHGPILLVIAVSWLASMLGILHGALFASLIQETVFCLFCFIAMALNVLWAGSVVWNLESQAYFIQWVNCVLPAALPMNALRAIMSKENAPLLSFIWPGLTVQLTWLFFSFIGCVYFSRIKK